MREYVGLCYLLCRLLDTIEDANWAAPEAQELAFRDFDHFIQEKSLSLERHEAVRLWVNRFPVDLVEGERLLLQSANAIFDDFHELPVELRVALARLIISMSGGMRHYMQRKARLGRLVLEGAADVNRYCFFVAGVVGEMLAVCRRVLRTREASPPFAQKLGDAFRFGLFLQKVNLLKDQADDEKLGRFLVPSRALVLSGLLRDADAAFRFLVGLPEKEVGFRLFCAWSLFLGLASLPWIQSAARSGTSLKIPREEAFQILNEVEARIQDNEKLVQLFEKLKPEIGQTMSERAQFAGPLANLDEEAKLLSLYRGELSESDVRALFRAELG